MTFTETRLPSGTMWYVNISGNQLFSSASQTINLKLSNGTYPFVPKSSNTTYIGSGGKLTGNGKPGSVSVPFSKSSFIDGYAPYAVASVIVAIVGVGGVTYSYRRRKR